MEAMAKVLMLTGMLVGFAYSTEFFMAWYSGSEWEGFIFKNRAFGPYGWAYFIMFTCNAIVPQIFWFKKLRRSIPVLFVVADPGQRGHVVRALRHRGDLAAPRLPALELGHVLR